MQGFLGFRERLRIAFFSGDVASAAIDEPALGSGDPGNPAIAAILVLVAVFIGGPWLRAGVPHRFPGALQILIDDKIENRGSDHFLRGPSEGSFDCGADGLKNTV